MSLREFVDGDGRVWQVWGTIPGTPHEAEVFAQSARLQAAAERRAAAGHGEAPDVARRSPVTPGRENGWLTFQSGEEKRRLSPIPPDWVTASDVELGRYLARAEQVRLSAAAAEMLGRPRGAG